MNSLHVLTPVQDRIPVRVKRDIPEMEKHAKVIGRDKHITAFIFIHNSCFSLEMKICGTPNDDCSQYATCADTGPGTYSCTCNEGYTGDGKSCKGRKHNIIFSVLNSIDC